MRKIIIFTLIFIAAISCTNYKGNLYRIRENNLYGFIDSTGNVIIKPKFKYVSHFQDGLALVISDIKEAYHIDTINSFKIVDGSFVVDSLNKTTRNVYDGIEVKYGYINSRGKIVIDTTQAIVANKNNFCIPYANVEEFKDDFINDSLNVEASVLEELLPNDGLILCQDELSKLWGYRNFKWEYRINPTYKYAGPFNEERAIINLSDTTKNIIESKTFGDYGVIDVKGNIIVEPKYANIRPYYNGYSWASILNITDFSISEELIDKEGTKILGPFPLSDFVTRFDFADNGISMMRVSFGELKLYSFLDTNHRFLSDFNNNGQLELGNETFENAKSFNDGYAPVKLNEKWVFINDDCEILSEEYDSTGVFSEGYAKVMFNGISDKRWGYVDQTFNLVIPYKYSECSDFHNGLAYFKNIESKGMTEGYIDKQGTVVWSQLTQKDK